MNNIKRKSKIALMLTALSVLALGICAVVSGTRKEDGAGFSGSYNLTAYAETSIKQITVSDKTVDVVDTVRINSTDGEYTLCLTVIDLADLKGLPSVQVGYQIGESSYFNGADSGLSNVVYSALTFANGSLRITDLKLDAERFTLPYFIVAEVPATSITDIFDCIVAEKHSLEKVEGYAATCTTDGVKDYYAVTGTEGNRYFTDVWGLHEIADLEVWKAGEGRIAAFGHTEVVDEAVAATCTESGLTEGRHCSVCNEVLVEQSVVDALGHTYLDEYEDEYCTVCHDHKQIVKTVNGVNYTLSYNTESGVSRYFVASGKAEGFNSLYCGDGAQTLVLENRIDGYPVTAIANEAFANTDGNAIKSVIIPANIVTIGERAFLDNYGMESAVFLAETVTVQGSFSEKEDGNTTPFYGCSSTEGGNSTNLVIYYNTVVFEGSGTNNYWTKFRRSGSGAIYHRYYVGVDPDGSHLVDYDHSGGGALHSSGWDYATANAVVNLNGVEGSSLTEDKANEILAKYYPVLSTTTFAVNEDIEASLKVDFAQFDINKNGITYKCEFTPALNTVNGYTVVTYSVSYSVAALVNVYSGVEFTYHGTTVAANTATEIMASVSDDSIKLDVPESSGYTFLGFAYKAGETLTFGVGEDIASAGNMLYVIWGHSNVGASFGASVNTSGTTLGAPVGDGIDGRWYDGSSEWNVVTEISTANTVVYTRSIFTLTVKLPYKAFNHSALHVGDKTSNSTLSKGTSIDMNIYEGTATFTLNNQVLTVNDGVNVTEIYANEIDWLGKETTKKRDITSSITGVVQVNSKLTVEISH